MDMTGDLEIKRTLDGSDTLFVPRLKEYYHSTFGAVQESRHVFIEQGLLKAMETAGPVSVFEAGFGTGLNALLTDLTAIRYKRHVCYTAIERFPLSRQIRERLNYPGCLPEAEAGEEFLKIHEAAWEVPVRLNVWFRLTKRNGDLLAFDLADNPMPGPPESGAEPADGFDIIYFDAFAPDVQPELWTLSVMQRMFSLLRHGGQLITYSCKGVVRRNLQEAGFSIEKLPGPPGKREILRALKR